MKMMKKKSNVPQMDNTPEWDKGGKSCILCDKAFGVFSRKHHCRNCGRLVCEACSQNKLILSLEGYSGTPQRVCTGCYKTLTRKKLLKAEAYSKKEKEERLLLESSKVRSWFVKSCVVFLYFVEPIGFELSVAGIFIGWFI